MKTETKLAIGAGILIAASTGVLQALIGSAIRKTAKEADSLIGDAVQTGGSWFGIPRTDDSYAQQRVKQAMDENDSGTVATYAPASVYFAWLRDGRPKSDGSPNNLRAAIDGFSEAAEREPLRVADDGLEYYGSGLGKLDDHALSKYGFHQDMTGL